MRNAIGNLFSKRCLSVYQVGSDGLALSKTFYDKDLATIKMLFSRHVDSEMFLGNLGAREIHHRRAWDSFGVCIKAMNILKMERAGSPEDYIHYYPFN